MLPGPNPLETLGIPQWLVEHELSLGPQGFERLTEYIGRVVRAARQLYHSDVARDEAERERYNSLLIKVDAAAQQLDDVTAVRYFARQLANPTGSPHTAQAQQLARQDEATTRRQLQTLMCMVSYVDSAAVLCRDNAEVVLGYQSDFTDDKPVSLGTYALEVGLGGLGMFYRLHHPVVDGAPAVMSYLEAPAWDEVRGVWQSEYVHKSGSTAPELRLHSFGRSELFGARLVGGLSVEDVRMLARRPQAGAATRELMGGGAPEDQGSLSWYTAEYAWWLEAMRAPVGEGDIAVIVNDGTGLMALAGQIVAMRDIDA